MLMRSWSVPLPVPARHGKAAAILDGTIATQEDDARVERKQEKTTCQQRIVTKSLEALPGARISPIESASGFSQ